MEYILYIFCSCMGLGCSSAVAKYTVKPVYNGHSQKDQKLVFKTNYCLMQVKSIAECSKGSILQYFQPLLSYNFVLSIFEWPLKTGFTVSFICLDLFPNKYTVIYYLKHLLF